MTGRDNERHFVRRCLSKLDHRQAQGRPMARAVAARHVGESRRSGAVDGSPLRLWRSELVEASHAQGNGLIYTDASRDI